MNREDKGHHAGAHGERESGSYETSSYRTISVRVEGAKSWLTLDRPQCLNALDPEMITELWDYFGRRQTDSSCRVIILRGAGKGFCAGLDLATPSGPVRTSPGDETPSLAGISLRMRACPQPVIAAVHGAACGGGFTLALAADVRLAGHSARMNVAFVRLGLSGCELGTSWFLPRLVGMSLTRELMMTGRFIDAGRALSTGLVSDVVNDADLDATARALADDMLALSPAGLRATKRTLDLALGMDSLEAVMRIEEHTQSLLARSPDFAEAKAAFLEKRSPRFVDAP